MAIEIILHIQNSDPILGEIDELPKTTDTLIKLSNPRQRDGKDIHFIRDDVVTVYWPIHTVSFIEILPGTEEDEIISFVRE